MKHTNPNCQCAFCRCKRGDRPLHKSNCTCGVCETKRGNYQKKKIEISKSLLYNEYIINKKSYNQIAKEFGFKPWTVERRLRDNNITIRSASEAQLGKTINHKQNCKCFICKGIRKERFGEKAPMFGKKQSDEARKKMSENSPWKNKRGKDTPAWKGTSSLYVRIKYLFEYIDWRKQIFERDNYTCQECYRTKCYLEVHHTKAFSKILKEFLQTYSQFSPIEDIETLVRLAITYEPFWDLSNGITLCEECHNLTKRGCKT